MPYLWTRNMERIGEKMNRDEILETLEPLLKKVKQVLAGVL